MVSERGAMTVPHVEQRSMEELIDINLLKHERSIEQICERFKNTVIVRALEIKGGNVSQAAVLLKTNRNNLVRWIQEFGIKAATE
jgi:DNA-binding NtrC family response regulator